MIELQPRILVTIGLWKEAIWTYFQVTMESLLPSGGGVLAVSDDGAVAFMNDEW
jgi:hypothetical protein